MNITALYIGSLFRSQRTVYFGNSVTFFVTGASWKDLSEFGSASGLSAESYSRSIDRHGLQTVLNCTEFESANEFHTRP